MQTLFSYKKKLVNTIKPLYFHTKYEDFVICMFSLNTNTLQCQCLKHTFLYCLLVPTRIYMMTEQQALVLYVKVCISFYYI